MNKKFNVNRIAFVIAAVLILESVFSESGSSMVLASEIQTSANEAVSADVVSEDNISLDEISEYQISEDQVSGDQEYTDNFSDAVSSGSVSDDIGVPVDDGVIDDGITVGVPEHGISLFSVPPAYFSSIDQGWVTAARDQLGSELCWAHSVCSLAETSMIKKGLADKNVNYSEDQLGYFFYNHATDPLGGTAGDATTPIGGNYYTRGGNNLFTTMDLASWISVRDDAEDPLPSAAHSTLDPSLAYSSAAHLENALWISTADTDHDLSYLEDLKQAVMDYGAASVNIMLYTNDINSNHAVYHSTGTNICHNVTIVGWDDNFVSGNFTTKPKGDGAWLIKDSYGTQNNRTADGCFWLSYYDSPLTASGSEAVVFDFGASDDYSNNYQYDGTSGIAYSMPASTAGGSIYAANVFTASGNKGRGELLKAVSFATNSVNNNYVIDVYLLDKQTDSPTSGKKINEAETSGSTEFCGYYTVSLNRPVLLKSGQAFAVAVKLQNSGKAKFIIDYSYQNSDWIKFVSSSKQHQSYYGFDGTTWTDGSSKDYTMRVKAFTVNSTMISSDMVQQKAFVYNGNEQQISLSDGSGEIVEGTDYTVSYNGDRKNVGTFTAAVSGEGLFYGGFTIPVTISAAEIKASLEGNSYIYTGHEIRPAVKVTCDPADPADPAEGTDYSVSYNNNVNAGTATVTVSADSNFTPVRTDLIFRILPKNISTMDIPEIAPQTYTGSRVEPAIDIGGLVRGSDYTVTYRNSVSQGTAAAVIGGTGNYTGEVVQYYTITAINAEEYPFTIKKIADQTYYPGKVCEPVLRVYSRGALLTAGADYTAVYSKNANAGTASVKITGVAGTVYDASVSQADFNIKQMSIKKALVYGIGNMKYVSGKSYMVHPELIVQNSSTGEYLKLKEGTDFEITYPDGNTGSRLNQTIKVKISGTGNFSGYVTKSFKLISKIPMSDQTSISVDLGYCSVSYDGTAHKPSVSVSDISSGVPVTLSVNTDYKVTYRNNKNAGRGYALISAKNHRGTVLYTGNTKVYFEIKGISLDGCYTAPVTSAVIYNGKEKKPSIRLYKSDGSRISASNFYVVYENNVNAGTASYTVYGKRMYSGVLAAGTFTIAKRSYKSISVKHVVSKSKNIDTVYVRYGNRMLRQGEGYDYTLSSTTDENGKYMMTILPTSDNFTEGTKLYK